MAKCKQLTPLPVKGLRTDDPMACLYDTVL